MLYYLPCVTSVPKYIINNIFLCVKRYGNMFNVINTNLIVFKTNIFEIEKNQQFL